MSIIVGVHGINQQTESAEDLRVKWGTSMKGGVQLAGGSLRDDALRFAFYGHLFRAPGVIRGTADAAEDAVDAFEQELLLAMWAGAAAGEPDRVVPPGATVRLAAPKSFQAGLRALMTSRFFVGISEPLLLGSLRQVRRYMREPVIRSAAQEAIDAVVTAETKVIIAHSLGSVVAYEALHRYADSARWANVRTFITLGSPLGIRNLIFDALDPAPDRLRGKWPALIRKWVNISDDHDVVALEKRLATLFLGNLTDIGVDNEARAHDVRPYLTARDTGAAIIDGLE